MRLYEAICDWFESMTILNLAKVEDIENDPGPQPEGAGSAHAEHAHSFSTEPEMHAGWRPDPTAGFEDRKRIGFAASE